MGGWRGCHEAYAKRRLLLARVATVERLNKRSRWLRVWVGLALYYLCLVTFIGCFIFGTLIASGRRQSDVWTLIDVIEGVFQSVAATAVFTLASVLFGFSLFLLWRGSGFRLRRIRLTIQHLMALALLAALACASLRYSLTWYILILCLALWPLLLPFIWFAIQMIRSTHASVGPVTPYSTNRDGRDPPRGVGAE
jgi:hypothetical protein